MQSHFAAPASIGVVRRFLPGRSGTGWAIYDSSAEPEDREALAWFTRRETALRAAALIETGELTVEQARELDEDEWNGAQP